MTVHFIRSGCGIPAIASWAQAFTAARGVFWLPGRDDLALLWNQAVGASISNLISYWKAGVRLTPIIH